MMDDASPDLILSLSKDGVAALLLPKSSILRQAQDEDFGAAGHLIVRRAA